MSTSEPVKEKKKEKTFSAAGILIDLGESGIEYVDRMRKEDLFAEESRSGFVIRENDQNPPKS